MSAPIVFSINKFNLGLKSYISIKTQEEWIGNAQGVTFLIELKEPAFDERCLSGRYLPS